jgi:enamine deaminase RidA (YjgF/YER057c/UK114 family)
MTPSQRLRELNIELPQPVTPVGSYIPATRMGRFILVSGQIPLAEGKLIAAGKVGGEVSVEDGVRAARQCGLNALAVAAQAAGTIDSLARIVRLAVYVNSAAGFTDQPRVANGASDLMVEIFGEAGKHVRAAVGASELPLNAAVEVELMAELRDDA